MEQNTGNTHISSFTGGLNLDIDKSLLKSNQYRYAENVRSITNEGASTGALTNIEGSTVIDGLTFAEGEVIIASATVRDLGVLFTVLASGLNKIYRVVFKADGTLDLTTVIGSLYVGTKNVLATNGVALGLVDGDNISLVCRYEDDDNIKVYWADGRNFIRSINIAPSNDAQNASVTLSSSFDIIPSADLKIPVIASIGSGRLNAGIIQYFYQLYGPSGTETMLSPGSAPINLTASDISDKSIKYQGTGLGEVHGKPTGKSVKVGIELPTDNVFNRVKLISVYYYDYSEVPVITVVKELDIASNEVGGFIYLEDGGTTAFGELTQAEFNLIGGNLFIPNYLESKDNILFAANVKEDTWDIPEGVYDTRSYQFKKEHTYGTEHGGYSKFYSVESRIGLRTIVVDPTPFLVLEDEIKAGDKLSGFDDIFIESVTSATRTIVFDSDIIVIPGPLTGITILEKKTTLLATISNAAGTPSDYTQAQLPLVLASHDSIHDEIYIEERYADIKCKYNADGNLGGTGINVDYLFANTYFIESYSDFWGTEPGVSSPSFESSKYIDRRTARIGDIKRNISSISVRESNGGVDSVVEVEKFGLSPHNGPLNYANPYLANILKSYQRDEIYRFAAVFYDAKGRKSPAHWIADIRFPAGYIKEENWDASIFEMPSETSNDGYIGDSVLSIQELLVKPLGVKFTFKNLNLLPNVKKIEIVRAKRDINNKTVYAQGVVQKVGTYRQEKNAVAQYDKIDGGIIDTLRPHPIISMGHSYSVVAPMYYGINGGESINNTGAYQTVSFDVYNSENYRHEEGTGIALTKYTNEAISPYFYDKNYLLFINPETSYYGVDFTEQIKSSVISPIVDIVDVIYPVTTPPVAGMAINTFGSSYYADAKHDKMQFRESTGTVRYATGMYAGADINKNNYAHDLSVYDGNTLITDGFVGTYFKWIANSDQSNAERTNIEIPDQSRMDIYNPILGPWNEDYVRAYISLGGVIVQNTQYEYGYNNGYAGLGNAETTGSTPPSILIDDANNSSRRALTFKYFARYSEALDGFGIGGYSIRLVNQLSNLYDDTSYNVITSLSIPSSQYALSRKINSFEFSGNIGNGIGVSGVSGSEYVSIGGKQYLNYTKPLTYGDGVDATVNFVNSIAKSKSAGLHGSGMIFNFEDNNQLPTIGFIDDLKKKYDSGEIYSGYELLDKVISTGLSTYVTNMKVMNLSIYGGSSIIDRQFTEYISTGSIINVSLSEESKYVFGGDTFIGIFDYTITHASDPIADTAGSTNQLDGRGNILLNQVKHVGAMIPLESSINLHMPTGKSFIASNYSIAIQEEPGVYSPGASGGSTWKYSQELPQFDYNAAYSAEQTVIGSISKLLISESDNVFDCRVYSSEPKTNDEMYDKWATFKVANYIDVDTQFGEITRLKLFANRLMFWQKNAFGVLSVNERSLISDNNVSGLTLGSAGILTRYDYVTTTNGMNVSAINNTTGNGQNLFWYDHDRAELCVYDGKVESVSKAKGIQSLLNRDKYDIEYNVPMVYDKKYNEIIMTLIGLGDATTIE